MREILLDYSVELLINYLFLLSSDPLFQRPFKVLNYWIISKQLEHLACTSQCTVTGFRQLLFLFENLWTVVGVSCLSGLANYECGVVWFLYLLFSLYERKMKDFPPWFYCCYLCFPPTIFLYSAFSRYFLHLLACAFLLDIKELFYAWGVGLILKDGDKSLCMSWLFVFFWVHMFFPVSYLMSELILSTEAKGL